jgi:DNA-binding transcriptional LysR family regulator
MSTSGLASDGNRFGMPIPRDSSILPCVSRPEGLIISPVVVSPNANLIRRFAQADDGIAFVPNSRVLKFVDEKDPLVRVLEREVVDHFELWMAVRSGERGGPIGLLGQAIGRLIKSIYVSPFGAGQ